MNNQGLGILGIASGSAASFDPLLFLAEVAMQDAMRDTSMQDAEMEDADTQEEINVSSVAVDEEPVAAMSAEPASSMATDSGGESDIVARAKRKAKGKARSQSTAEDRVTGATRMAQNLQDMIEAEESKIMKEMKEEEEADKRTEQDGAGNISPEEIEALVATGITPEDAVLTSSVEEEDADVGELLVDGAKRRRLRPPKDPGATILRKKLDVFGELSRSPELIMEMAKHLHIKDLVSLYAISKDVHETIDGHLSHIMKACAAYNAPESSRIFVFTLYRSLCIPDPAGRPDPLNPAFSRMVPSLRWLQMVMHREKCVRNILACMAREGHRMPKTMPLTLKKMWLTMDISTSARRVQLMHNERYWTDFDLYNAQMFFIKLDLRFNDPIEGPADDGLRKLMLGQRGLTPLCRLLKRTKYTDVMEIFEAAIRYSYWPRPEYRNLPIFGVPPNEIGRGHLEGWGLGRVHLYRLDELVMRESCRRNMQLSKHLLEMIIWGYVDKATGKNIKVTEEEMYMSDDPDNKKEREERKRKTTVKHKRRRDRERQDGGGDTSMIG
jgi:hypothetical protein